MHKIKKQASPARSKYKISNNVNIPILMYNVPSRTGCNINPDTVIDIIKNNKNIIGIKEASGDINQVKEINELSNKEKVFLDIYSGNDDDVINVLGNRGKGVISVCANIVPKRTHDMITKYIDGDINESLNLQKDNKELSDVLFSEVNPIPVKSACYKMGLIKSDTLRLPLTSISSDDEKRLVKVLKKQKLL